MPRARAASTPPLLNPPCAARFAARRTPMPRGEKSAYSDQQKRQAEHNEESVRGRGGSEEDAERIGWATVNKETGGARGRKKTTKKSARKSSAKKATRKTAKKTAR